MKNNHRNDGQGRDSILQNTFTAYVEKALQHNRIKYAAKTMHLTSMEVSVDMERLPETKQDEKAEDGILDLIYGQELDMLENLTLFDALKELDEKDLMIVKLHVIYEYSYKQVAVIMGMTLPAVRSRYSRAIRQLRLKMEKGK